MTPSSPYSDSWHQKLMSQILELYIIIIIQYAHVIHSTLYLWHIHTTASTCNLFISLLEDSSTVSRYNSVCLTHSVYFTLSVHSLIQWKPGNPVQEEAEGLWQPEGTEDTKRRRPSNPTEQSSWELTETEAASTGPVWCAPDPLSVYHGLEFSTFVGLLVVWTRRSMILVPALETFFLLLVCFR